MNLEDVLTEPKKLVRQELKNAGFDLDTIKVPRRVYLLADSLFDVMAEQADAENRYPLGGDLYVFRSNENVGFIKGNMCSPAIATQAEDLIAGGVEELIHVGFAGGLQTDMRPGDVVLTDGAYNDTAVARLYGFDCERIESTKKLTNQIGTLLEKNGIHYRRGQHWTTDAGYRETLGQVFQHREMGDLCVEMEGVGLFTIAKYRRCSAAAVYVISDVHKETGWDLGWGDNTLDSSVDLLIGAILSSISE